MLKCTPLVFHMPFPSWPDLLQLIIFHQRHHKGYTAIALAISVQFSTQSPLKAEYHML